MKSYVAGSPCHGWENTLIELQINKLYSALIEKRQIERWQGRKPLLIDSGAHSWNKQTLTGIGSKEKAKGLPDIGQWLTDYESIAMKYLREGNVVVELDCYNILPEKKINALTEKLLAMNPEKIIRVNHPWTDGGSMKKIHEWIAQGIKYIGVANDTRIGKLLPEFFNAVNLRAKVHGFAITSKEILLQFPFYSVDSTRLLSGFRFGAIFIDEVKSISPQKKCGLMRQSGLQIAQTQLENFRHGCIELLKMEKYVTDVWAKRGVAWKE